MTMNDHEEKTIEFNNESIVLTDPCYIMNGNDAELTDYGMDMSKIGYSKSHTVRNGYGDGGWVVKNKKNGKKLGEIWADSGETGVYLLEEIREHDPDFFNTRVSFCAATLIGFTGNITFKFKEICDYEDNMLWKSHILILEGSGKIEDGTEIEFSVDFSKDFALEEQEENT